MMSELAAKAAELLVHVYVRVTRLKKKKFNSVKKRRCNEKDQKGDEIIVFVVAHCVVKLNVKEWWEVDMRVDEIL